MNENLITRAQLIGAMNVSESTIRRLETGGLPFTFIGPRSKRYNLLDVKAWLKGQDKKCLSGRTERAESTLALCLGDKEFTDACRRTQLRVLPKP